MSEISQEENPKKEPSQWALFWTSYHARVDAFKLRHTREIEFFKAWFIPPIVVPIVVMIGLAWVSHL